jgi:hypothetical protein
MAVYQISYDLRGKRPEDYESLWTAIKQYPNVHLLGSTWLLQSNGSAANVYSHLHSHFHVDDRLLISEVTANCSGWLNGDVWTWVNARRAA